METNSNLSANAQNTSSNTPLQGFGKVLQQAREKKNISLDDASKELFILKRHLQAIEAEDYAALPQQTFARGFVVNYAKFLGVDSQAMAQSFDAHYPAHLRSVSSNIQSPMQPIGTLQRESRGKIKLNPLFIGLLFLALGIGIFLFKTINKAHTDTQTATDTQSTIITPQEQATGASLGNTGSAVSPAMPVSSPNTSLTNTGVAITPAVQSPQTVPTSTVSPSQALATTPTTGEGELEFWVKNNTNVTVTDATGAVLVQGEKPRGGFKVTGQPPFNINIDKASNVTLNFNKEPIKLAQYAQNNQANFSLK